MAKETKTEKKNDKECCGEDCGCSHNHARPSIEDIAYNNHFLLNTLIGMLIEKKVISEAELRAKLDEIAKSMHQNHQQ